MSDKRHISSRADVPPVSHPRIELLTAVAAVTYLHDKGHPIAVPSPLPSYGRGEGQGEVRVLREARLKPETLNFEPDISFAIRIPHSAFYNRAFTLIEMLTVISIIAIIAALTVPVLKNFGKSDITISASRQLLDDIGRARQLAMSQRTTVYMVFVPTNFWGTSTMFSGGLNPAQGAVATNVLGLQLTGYTYLADGAIGDQPGQHQWHYLAPWQSLPEGAYIPLWKFYNSVSPGQTFNFSDPVNNSVYFNINAFTNNNLFPFPTQDATNLPVYTQIYLPYIAFNYLGQLCTYSGQLLTSQNGIVDQDYTGGGIDIPLAQGSLVTDKDPTSRMLLVGPPQVVENPPGNATNISYNVVHIDPLTGRATLLYHKMQ
jgi:prepilin-type N-terminal cleavage/methylation domain-containing protein